jgi:uncharacterized membrane protein YcaP (DUF421 family)
VDIALRAIVLFLFVFVVIRVIGRRELSTIAPFDLVLLIVLGDAIQQGLTQDDYSVTGTVIAVGTLAAMQVGFAYTSYRVPRLRPVLEGEPVVILEDGKLIEKNLRRERITPEEVMEAARLQQIASLGDVRWAVLERNGSISFLGKS